MSSPGSQVPRQGSQPARQHVSPALAETIQAIVRQTGQQSLTPETANAMAPSVEYHLREVIQEASKFMRHSKRTTLLTRDVNNALRSMGIEQLFGYFSAEPLRFQKVAGSSGGLYAVHDPVLQLDEVIKEKPVSQLF